MSTSLLSAAVGGVDVAARRRAALAYGLASTVAIGVYFLLSGNTQAIAFEVIGASAVVAIWVGLAGRDREDRIVWQLFAVGLLGQVAGDVVSTFYEVALGREAPLPSIADAFYLGGYPMLVVGLYLLLRRRLGGRMGWATLVDGLIVVAAIGTVQWIFVVDHLLKEKSSTLAHIIDVAYPSVDVLLLVALAQLAFTPSASSPRLRLLTLSVVLWAAADEVFLFTASSYHSGEWLDVLWLGSYAAWGAAALLPAREETAPADVVPRAGASRIVMLAAALLAAPVALGIERLSHNDPHPLAVFVGSVIVVLLVVARLATLLRAEREVTEAAEQLERMKTDFLASVSHELRTPLTSIVGYVEMLDDEPLDAEQRRYVRIVERNSERLLSLVQDLLLVAGMERGTLELERELVDVAAITAEATEDALPTADAAGLVLRLERAGPALVLGDRSRLAQLVDNLVSNAIKFTPEGGAVLVRVEPQGHEVVIEVGDNGIGIPRAEQARLFDRFFRSSNAVDGAIPGTGLGLHIAKAIVDAHEGTIEVHSRVGTGTAFTIRLPAVPA